MLNWSGLEREVVLRSDRRRHSNRWLVRRDMAVVVLCCALVGLWIAYAWPTRPYRPEPPVDRDEVGSAYAPAYLRVDHQPEFLSPTEVRALAEEIHGRVAELDVLGDAAAVPRVRWSCSRQCRMVPDPPVE